MKKLMGCALAMMAIAATAKADLAKLNLWNTTLFTANHAIESVPPGVNLQSLVSITTDRDMSRNSLSAMIDGQGQITGLYGVTTDGADSGEQVFPLADIESAKGSVLAVVSGRNALILQGALNRNTQEGRFRINYLTNGLFMKYSTCEFDLKKDVTGASYVQNAYTGARVTEVRVISHKLGITTLQGICPAQ
ncbi:MAG: hypothetical protein EOP11_21850 [Proteobacteria bacterium]|nr:MAG: hypothetical protein EOP11_21850 [Pseudomonadota bacterium]